MYDSDLQQFHWKRDDVGFSFWTTAEFGFETDPTNIILTEYQGLDNRYFAIHSNTKHYASLLIYTLF